MNVIKVIKIIIPYFGKLPDLAQLFFLSCSTNKCIRFLLFTDQKKTEGLPENVEYFFITLKGFNRLASHQLGLKINILFPYKLCDFKPMYGKIFEDYLIDAHFWGYCDLDMIFGNSNEFLTADLLNSYDIITARKDSLAGNFTLYKNEENIKNLFLKSDCWRQIVQYPCRVYSFPEKFKPTGKPVSRNVFHRFIKTFHSPDLSKKMIPDMNTILSSQPEIKVYYGNFMLSDMLLKNRGITSWELNWKNGVLTEKGSEHNYLYFHFYFLKNEPYYFMNETIDYQLIKSLTITSESIEINY